MCCLKKQVTDLQLVVRLMVSVPVQILLSWCFFCVIIWLKEFCKGGFPKHITLAAFSTIHLTSIKTLLSKAGPLWEHVGHHHLPLSLQAGGQRNPCQSVLIHPRDPPKGLYVPENVFLRRSKTFKQNFT